MFPTDDVNQDFHKRLLADLFNSDDEDKLDNSLVAPNWWLVGTQASSQWTSEVVQPCRRLALCNWHPVDMAAGNGNYNGLSILSWRMMLAIS